MKAAKYILLTLITIIAIPLVVALFLPSDYSVQRNKKIEKSQSEVFQYLRFLKNQDDFSVWAAMDPKMKKLYSGNDGTVGFISAWDSNNDKVGKGEQEIKKIIPDSRIEYELRFLEPYEDTAQAWLSIESLDKTSSRVTWGFDGKMPYPMNIMQLGYDLDQLIGKDLEAGLVNLKKVMESNSQ